MIVILITCFEVGRPRRGDSDSDDGDDGDGDGDDGDVDDGDHLFWGGEAQKGRRAHGCVHSQADLVVIIVRLTIMISILIIVRLAIMIFILIIIETFLVIMSDDS